MDLTEKKSLKEATERHASKCGIAMNFSAVPDYEAEQIKIEKECAARPLKFVTPKMLTPFGGRFYDPCLGREVMARVSEVRWFERNGAGIVRPKVIERKHVKRYMERAEESAHKRMREGTFETGDYTDSTSSEFLPGVPGPYTRQLYLPDYWKMVAKSFEAFNHNPIAHGGVLIKTAFTIGQGVRFTTKDNELSDFMTNWIIEENYNSRLSDAYDMLQQNGELIREPWRVKRGWLSFNNIDPPTIWEIITNPRNINQIYGYWMQYQTQYQIKTEHAKGKGSEQTAEYVIENIPPERILRLRINCHENEKRGRSDLFSCLGWLKWIKDHYWHKVIRSVAESAFVYDHLVEGSSADVRRVAASYTQFPKPASIFFHNNSQTRTLMGYNGAAATRAETGDELLNLICIGFGIPKEYFGIGETGSRAQAVVATDPFGKQIIRRRQKLEHLIRKEFSLVIKEAVNGGLIPSTCLTSDFEISWDELAPESTQEKITTLSTLERDGVISHRRYAELAAQEVNITAYSYEEEQKEIQEERQNSLDSMPTPTDSGLFGKEPEPPLFEPKPKEEQPKAMSKKDRSKIKDEHRS